MSTITYNIKEKLKINLHRYEKTAFHETPTAGLGTDVANNVPSIDGIVNNAAIQRIGQVTVDRKDATFTAVITDPSIGVTRIGRITLLGDAASLHGQHDNSQGKNVDNLELNACSLLPHITVNSDSSIDSKGNINNYYSHTTFGQLNSYYFNNITADIDKQFIPFYDFPGILDPVHYVSIGGYYRGYMIINNNKTDYLHYIEPDSIINDGAIDVFQVRSQKANTDIQDIQTKGIRASICSGDWDLPSHSVTELKKGTSMIDTKAEFEQSEYDWFEDCQDLVFGSDINQFEKTKSGIDAAQQSSGYKYSLDGYVSEGKYLSSPFKDTTPNENVLVSRYSHSGNIELRSSLLLSRGSRSTSEIGTRFKSSGNGVILRPKYESSTQTILGTDSIAFAGLLRE